MPAPSTGATANAATLLSAFGETVRFVDGSADIEGIFRYEESASWNPSTNDSELRHLPRLWVPDVSKGSLAAKQEIVIRTIHYFVRNIEPDEDGWLKCILEKAPVPSA